MNKAAAGFLWLALGAAAGCQVGPPYRPPAVSAPPAFKELTPADFKNTDGWKAAQPSDAALHGKWWEMFQDPQLNVLEEDVAVSNQTIAASFASFQQARALVREARAAYFPTLGVSPGVSRQRVPGGAATGGAGTGFVTYTDYSLPFDASWTPDLWDRVRNTVSSNVAAAQSSAADLENARLTAQAELAVDYYELQAQDSLIKLLDDTALAYEEALAFNRAQQETGVGTPEAVAQAQVQLETTRAQATGLRIARAQYEHAIALLVGKAASMFSLAAQPLHVKPPAIPFGVPSELLERRPDIAAHERLMAQANAQIGLARAAYFPTLTLSASAGFESVSASRWLEWPSRVWSVGPTMAENLFDAGLRRATVEQYRAAYDQTVANYRQAVLMAFQQVEDNLAALRILSQEVAQQDAAVMSAQRYLAIATDRYKLGLDPYLNVITAQTALLGAQQTELSLRTQQITDSVQLIEALGGGWQAVQLPAPKAIMER